MEIINNISKTLKDDISIELKDASRVSIAASCFSMYAYGELKKQFDAVADPRFMFTSPSFLAEKPAITKVLSGKNVTIQSPVGDSEHRRNEGAIARKGPLAPQ
jgi:hypothetical protein